MTIHSYISITHTDIDTYTGLNAVTAVISPLNDPHSSPPQMSSESASHTLYCAEDAADLDSSDADTCIPHHHHHPPPPFTSSSPHSPPSDEGAAVAELIYSEARHMPEPDYLRRCRNVTARQDSVNWILKVHARHRFSPATAFLSVNYFDRFLSSCSLPVKAEWVAVSAAVRGVPVAGGEDGGATCPPATGPPNVRPQVRVRAQDGSENGALGHVESRLAIALRHSLRFPPFLHLQAPFFFFFFLLSRPPLAVADLLRLLRSRPQHHP
ncbi:hypothetical protein TIFTF001_007200 [Ficus carica]|uniref:B-like cyclin n=1 Tax=Ficus carica TaxID=3494 RepID=A0AA87ZSZ5_FICCA|nr:hypothetical protein TIFTF001_007200 [Ficus carica]